MRRYRAIREGLDIIAKKKRALLQRKKKVDLKPMIVIKKQDGEFTVSMEVLKKYSKERLVFQPPFEEKDPLVYTIGKTEAEKNLIQKQREKRERRETRRKSKFLQSTFRDKCQEICVKAYNQAIGILPLPNPNNPECPCQTGDVHLTPPIDSCSCSEAGSVTSSDTDGDNWTIEFTPPAGVFDPKAKHPPILTDNETQYSYLDYKVKLFDRRGNPIPRYFKGPDGRQECSDLGGFWAPGHVWVEINKDGFIGPDNRWIPMNFIGPDGMAYTAEEPAFTDSSGRNLKIGIDGYIDKDGKWAWYKKKISCIKPSQSGIASSKKTTKSQPASKVSGSPVSNKAAGRTSPQQAAPPKGAIKGSDKKDDKAKKTVTVKGKGKSPVVMSVSVNYKDSWVTPRNQKFTSSGKYNADQARLAKYREIMQGLEMYDDLHELRMPKKANRASNTPRKAQVAPPVEYYD